MGSNDVRRDEEEGTTVLTIKTAVELRIAFVRKVYALVLSQLLLTVLVGGVIFRALSGPWVRANNWALGLSTFLTFSSLMAIACLQGPSRRFPSNYVLLYTFTSSAAITIGLTSLLLPWQGAALAVAVTAAVFLMLTAYAWTTTTDFAGYAPYVHAAMAVLFSFTSILWMLSWCFGLHFSWMVMLYNLAGVLLFTFYIVFDTQRIIGEWGGHSQQFTVDDSVLAALHLYVDLFNLLMHLLSLVRYLSERQGFDARQLGRTVTEVVQMAPRAPEL